ncbi:contact-dependent growth inhibition system immunity protein [Bosea sp. RAC05]|uniref:contact-dependent growth inhibition system immunity protein n=1 Tax=Bosea sp. RAC05 TaxID=1842539 RepID=UPI0012376EC4|nr:contact-dependent growth inhibition system immunity protein [Bosea sp. RAC05]
MTGTDVGSVDEASTNMVGDLIGAWKTPLDQLTGREIRLLISQQDGYPYVLDLVWPMLEDDPLLEAEFYPGDILSSLMRADDTAWRDRPNYKRRLKALYERALRRPDDETEALRESLEP